MALSRIARKLYESIEKGDESDYRWFEEALTASMRTCRGLDEVIWGAVRELLEQEAAKRKN